MTAPGRPGVFIANLVTGLMGIGGFERTSPEGDWLYISRIRGRNCFAACFLTQRYASSRKRDRQNVTLAILGLDGRAQ
jgi:hypothetical protein